MAGKSVLKFLIAIWLLLIWLPGQTQNRCSTVEYERMRRSPKSKRETVHQFEQWMQSRLLQNKLMPFVTMSSAITIPVVVHVIHNGTADITNISDAQILSQIDVLNKDFKRLNLDAINTPPQFQPVAGSLDIEFVLAKQNPEGLATNGITRTPGTKTQWTIADQSEFKALNYWAAENYLNIWIIKFSTFILIK